MRRGDRNGEQAQALIEFALFAIVLLYFFLGTVDLGRFLYYDNAIRSAARVGAGVASNHCAYAGYACGTTSNAVAVSDNFVMWSTYCEASSYVNLNLGQYPLGQANTMSTGTQAYVANGSFGPCAPNDSSKTWTPTCAGGASCSNCSNDICIAPSARSSGTDVSVSVGYDFQPITPLMSSFFSSRQCWLTSDSPAPSASDSTSNNHTLCARSVGKVY
jgi:hypothetical protein